VGGAKVSDKIELLQNLMKFADSVLIGGAMAYTFLKAQGVEVGLSKVEEDKLDLARDLLQFAERRSIDLRLPLDHIVAEKLDASAAAEVTPTRSIPANRLGVDIGPATRADYAATSPRPKPSFGTGRWEFLKFPVRGRHRAMPRRRGFIRVSVVGAEILSRQ